MMVNSKNHLPLIIYHQESQEETHFQLFQLEEDLRSLEDPAEFSNF